MKRILKSLAAVALVALTASCSKEQPVAPPSGEAAVEFTVAAPELMTKAIADGKTVDKVACEVYNADGKLITNAEISKTIAMSGGKATFAVRLVTGQTYSFLFWAYKDGAPYTLDAAGKKVTVDYAGASNAENRDAFYAYVADKKITSSVNETVTLTRPFAQVNFGVTKADIDAAANSGIVVKKSSVKVSGLATELNLTDGSVSGTAEASFTVAALPDEELTVGGTAYGYVAMNYVLVGKDAKSLSDVELKLYKEDGTEINTVSVPNVPLQGNYRTNILGNLFTSDVQLNVVVNPGFSEPDYEKEVWDGSTVNEPKQDAEGNYLITKASELAWVAQQTNAGTTFAGKTVLLTDDIDLNNQTWTPIGTAANSFKGTFDGQNHTISSLYVHSAEQNANLGLFGRIESGLIKNFTISGAKVISEVTAGDGARAGVAVGDLHVSDAENIKVVNAKVQGAHYLGGIIGSGYCSITNCSAENVELVATALLQSNGEYDYGDKVGGILGLWGESNAPGYVISGSSVKNVKITGYRDLGGIVGVAQEYDNVKNCSIDGVTITVDMTHNYKNYAASSSFNANNYIGSKRNWTGTETGNSGNVTVNYAGTATTQAELEALVGVANATVTLADGTYDIPGSVADGITIKGESKDAIIKAENAVTWGGAKFENLTYKNSNGNYIGIQHASSVSYKDCVIEGKPTMYAATATFDNCTFKQSSYEYCIWTYGSENITFTNCTFDTMGKAVKVYIESADFQQTATFDGCNFKATNVPEGKGKAAIEIDGRPLSGGSKVFNVIINNCTETGFVAGENSKDTMWNCDLDSKAVVTVDGTVVYENK